MCLTYHLLDVYHLFCAKAPIEKLFSAHNINPFTLLRINSKFTVYLPLLLYSIYKKSFYRYVQMICLNLINFRRIQFFEDVKLFAFQHKAFFSSSNCLRMKNYLCYYYKKKPKSSWWSFCIHFNFTYEFNKNFRYRIRFKKKKKILYNFEELCFRFFFI